MSFIKNFGEKLLEWEFSPIMGLNRSEIGENTEHIGYIKQVGSIAYGVVAVNTDIKYDYKGFYKDVLSFFSQLERVVVIGVFVSAAPDNELLDFTERNIDDYRASLVDIRWVVDTEGNRLIVRGSQPDRVIDVERLVYESFNSKECSQNQTLSTVNEKSDEKGIAHIKSNGFYVTAALIIINGIIELYALMGGDFIIEAGAIEKSRIMQGQWYRIITYMFIHGSAYHYLCNALSLYIFGSRIEKYMGRLKMLMIYFISGIGAGILSAVFNNGMAVGASGAISGLMAGVLTYTRVKKRSMEGLDSYIMLIFAMVGIFSGFLLENIDNFGHIGGFVTGIAVCLLLLKGDKNEKA